MTGQDWVLALTAGAPLTSVGGVWLLGLVMSQVRSNLTLGNALSLVALLVFNGSLLGAGAIAIHRSYMAYGWFHPYVWVWLLSIVWFVLLALFYLAGMDRKGVIDLIESI